MPHTRHLIILVLLAFGFLAETVAGLSHTVDTRCRLSAIETNTITERTDPDASGGGAREEYYYYDGVRRIQEVFHDPTSATPPWPQTPGSGGGSNPQWRTEAEFIWSAASGVAIDTLHTQIDWWDREAWPVQDHATGTVRAYTDPSGEVAEQYGFDAFGRLVRRDEFRLVRPGSQGYYRTFRQRVGHHGLIAERLDHHTNARTLDVGADLWMQSRSRWYAPDLGRFITPDPNGTGAPVMSTLAMLGTVPTGPPSGAFEWDAHLGDGFDMFGGYGGDPVNGTDPTGLFFGILGLFAPVTTIDIYTDYNDQVLEGGLTAYAQGGTGLSNYSNWQMAMVDAALDMSPQGVDHFSMLSTAPMAVKMNRHHLIPKFMYGLDGKSNLVELPEAEHRRLHQLIGEEFERANLRRPSSSGDEGWRKRLLADQVSTNELDRAKEALRRSASRFDMEFPELKRARGSLRKEIDRRLLEYADELPDTLRRARNARRRRR